MKSSVVAVYLGVVLSSALPFDLAIAAEQEAQPATLANPVAAQSIDQLSATLDRPLFSPSRHPPAPPPPPPPVEQASAPPPAPPPNLVLYGVVMDGESARALVRVADNKIRRAQIGDDIDGWKVSQIEGRKLVLSLDDRFATFTIFSHDHERRQSVGEPASGNELKNIRVEAAAQAVKPQPTQPGKRRRSRE